MSRREQLHANIRQEIKTVARQHMRDQGTAEISLNAIAKTMEISAPALYRYYDDRSALITDLIIDAYRAFADSLEMVSKAHADLSPRERLLETLLTYREWALAHPIDYQLIYGNPVPGYTTPTKITAVEAWRSFKVILELLVEAAREGKLKNTLIADPAFEITLPVGLKIPDFEPDIPTEAIYVCVVGWTRIHGLITLEMFHHLNMIGGDIGAYFRHEVNAFLTEFLL